MPPDLQIFIKNLDDNLRLNFCKPGIGFHAAFLDSYPPEKLPEEVCVSRAVYTGGPHIRQLEEGFKEFRMINPVFSLGVLPPFFLYQFYHLAASQFRYKDEADAN